jgi:hypothetical protein
MVAYNGWRLYLGGWRGLWLSYIMPFSVSAMAGGVLSAWLAVQCLGVAA